MTPDFHFTLYYQSINKTRGVTPQREGHPSGVPPVSQVFPEDERRVGYEESEGRKGYWWTRSSRSLFLDVSLNPVYATVLPVSPIGVSSRPLSTLR